MFVILFPFIVKLINFKVFKEKKLILTMACAQKVL